MLIENFLIKTKFYVDDFWSSEWMTKVYLADILRLRLIFELLKFSSTGYLWWDAFCINNFDIELRIIFSKSLRNENDS